MSGMLPGVECARRRRFHNSAHSAREPKTRSFSLYIRNLHHNFSSSSLLERSMLNQSYPVENLGGAAGEAKRRLDEKFMTHNMKLEKELSDHKRKGLFHALWWQLKSEGRKRITF